MLLSSPALLLERCAFPKHGSIGRRLMGSPTIDTSVASISAGAEPPAGRRDAEQSEIPEVPP